MSIAPSIWDRLEDRLSTNRKIALRRNKEKLVEMARAFRRNRSAVLGLIIIIAFTIISISAPYIAPYGTQETVRAESGAAMILEPPSLDHPMGTTNLGRDVFSQWMYGGQVSLLVGLISGIAVVTIGTTVGLVSGYYKGTVDLVLMRIVDILYAIPATPLVLIVAMFYGSSVWNVVIAFALVLWRSEARAIRSQTLSLSERPFVKSARAVGSSDRRIMGIHILPNLVPLILIEGTFVTGAAIVLEAGISFLGLGATEMLSWGTMLQLTFSSGAINVAWWWVIPPGLSIMILVLSLFYISRGLEQITNPEIRRM